MDTTQENNQQPLNRQLTEEEKRKQASQALKNFLRHQRWLKSPLNEEQMKKLRYSMNMDWEETEKMDGPERQEKRMNLLYERFHYLNDHLLIWEEERERDRTWKKKIETELSNFMEDADELLKIISEQAQKIMDGDTASQGEMTELIMGTLNELRGRVSGLENTVNSLRIPAGVQKK